MTPNQNKILERAKELLLEGWCKGAIARKNGEICGSYDRDADSFCIYGALTRAQQELELPYTDIYAIIDKARTLLNQGKDVAFHSVGTFNDSQDKVESVIEFLNKLMEN